MDCAGYRISRTSARQGRLSGVFAWASKEAGDGGVTFPPDKIQWGGLLQKCWGMCLFSEESFLAVFLALYGYQFILISYLL